MADITQTPGSVYDEVSTQVAFGRAGETITAGMPVYKHTDGLYYKALNDSSDHAKAVGIALNGSSLAASLKGQQITIQIRGEINLGATLVVGEVYCVSNTAGKICPIADIGATEFQTVLGVAKSAALLIIGINASGVAHA